MTRLWVCLTVFLMGATVVATPAAAQGVPQDITKQLQALTAQINALSSKVEPRRFYLTDTGSRG